MRKRTYLYVVAIGLIIIPMVYLATAGVAQAAGNCTDWDGKDETAPFSITAPAGYVITSITIKSGDDCFTYTTNGDKETDANGNACYRISGIGSQTGEAEKIGVGHAQVCQDISHIEASWTQTAQDTATNTPQNTPTDTATPTEENTPTDTPTATEVTEDTPTPTATDPSEEDTPTPTEESRDTPTATDPGDPKSSPTPTGIPYTTVCSRTGERIHVRASEAWRYANSGYSGENCDPVTGGSTTTLLVLSLVSIASGFCLLGYIWVTNQRPRRA